MADAGGTSTRNVSGSNETSIWCKLVINDENVGSAKRLKFYSVSVIVEDIRDLMKKEFKNSLANFDAAVLEVYAANDDKTLLEADVEWNPNHGGTTRLKPLLVEVPQSATIQDSNNNDSLMPILAAIEQVQLQTKQAQQAQQQTLEQVLLQNQQAQQTQQQTLEQVQLMLAYTNKRITNFSAASISDKNCLLDFFGVIEKGASWPNKPVVVNVEGFQWHTEGEASIANRTACMDYLNELLQIPNDYALADVSQDSSLLNLKYPFQEEMKGTTDVVIAKLVDVKNQALRHNIEALLELKKPENSRNKDAQTVYEHFAASFLNSKHGVVSVLTDLNKNWIFFWFGKGDDSKMVLFKLCLDNAAEAKYLLDNIYDDSKREFLPTTFADRLSFAAIASSHNAKKRSREEGDHDNNDESDLDSKPAPSRGADRHRSSGTNANVSSGGDITSYNNCQDNDGGSGGAPSMASMLSRFADPSYGDIANELDLMDMVDEREQYEIFRSFAAKHMVPYTTGSYDIRF